MSKPTNKNGIEYRTHGAALQVARSADGSESRTIEGMAIVFGKPSEPLYEDDTVIFREVIAPGAVTREFLDKQDILCTLYHDNDRILARSKYGKGTLRYDVTEEGVKFSFDALHNQDGDTALELVRSGDVDGCSFAFLPDYTLQERTVGTENGKRLVTITVNAMERITDFTLTPRPAYRDTEVSARMRDLVKSLLAEEVKAEAEDKPEDTAYLEEVRRLRSIANSDY